MCPVTARAQGARCEDGDTTGATGTLPITADIVALGLLSAEVSWSMFPWGSCVHIANWEAPGDKLFSAGNPNKTILQEDSSKLSSPTVSPAGQQGFPFPSQAPAPLPPQGTLPRSGRGRGAIPVQGAQSPAVGWWEMFAGGGGLAAILPLP